MSLTDLLNRRRSVRHYDETPIDADTVRRACKPRSLRPAARICSFTSFIMLPIPPF